MSSGDYIENVYFCMDASKQKYTLTKVKHIPDGNVLTGVFPDYYWRLIISKTYQLQSRGEIMRKIPK